MSCPAPDDLLLAALGTRRAPLLDRHVRECPQCEQDVHSLREAVDALRLAGLPDVPPEGPCLDDFEIAAFVDGVEPASDGDRSRVEHLASCGRCRGELAAATLLVQDSAVAREIAALAPLAPRRRGPLIARLTAAAGLVAAALIGLTLGLPALREADQGDGIGILREPAITTTAAPRILAPAGVATQADSLRWTSVPGADLYRITVWDREGTVVWEGETRDTQLDLPPEVVTSGAAPLLWDVKARTGWGRWVASELGEFTVQNPGGTR